MYHADRRTDGRTDGQTDMTKLIVAFSNFVKPPKNDGVLGEFQIREIHTEYWSRNLVRTENSGDIRRLKLLSSCKIKLIYTVHSVPFLRVTRIDQIMSALER
jgi:hypothetical protein